MLSGIPQHSLPISQHDVQEELGPLISRKVLGCFLQVSDQLHPLSPAVHLFLSRVGEVHAILDGIATDLHVFERDRGQSAACGTSGGDIQSPEQRQFCFLQIGSPRKDQAQTLITNGHFIAIQQTRGSGFRPLINGDTCPGQITLSRDHFCSAFTRSM